MKPLLIVPPSPARWQAVQELFCHEETSWLGDLRKRLVTGIDGSQDALAVMPESAHALAGACIRRRHDIGVLGHLFTRTDHRLRGHARLLMQTLLSWFDMTGGRWLYVTSPRELVAGLFEKFGFRLLRQKAGTSQERVTMLRTPVRAGESPFEGADGPVHMRAVARSDWPLLVSLLQHHPGSDPRVSLEESALTAEATALELIDQQESGDCRLIAASRRKRIVGLGSVATGQAGPRTYAMLLPHDHPPEGLRSNMLDFARTRGYAQVDFPLEALAKTTAGGASASALANSPPPP